MLYIAAILCVAEVLTIGGGVKQVHVRPDPHRLAAHAISFEDLEKFARSPNDPHLPAWQRFNRTVGSDGSVGIFHETFIVERGNYEAIYGNMPVFGLAKATEHVRAIGGRETARRRLMRGENEPAVPSP